MLRLSALVLLAAGFAPVQAADTAPSEGQVLHDSNCNSCHASRFGGDAELIYTREDRRVDSFAALAKQVRFCKDTIGLTWFDEEVDSVVTHLNNSFYHYPTKP